MKKILIIIAISICCQSCESKYPFKLLDNYFLDIDPNSYFHLINASGTILIKGNITKYNTDSQSVILEVQPIELILNSTGGKKINNYNVREEFIRNNMYREYWILTKKNVLGPLNKSQFLLKRKELGVSIKLKLNPTR